MNETNLFNSIREILGPLSQIQVDSTHAILQACTAHNITDNRQVAYILATACHESGLQPISEHLESRQGHSYNNPDPLTGKIYYGRGFVQLTWKGNYMTFGRLIGVDLVSFPEQALEIPNASQIIVIGMKDGRFTGVGLSKYFNDERTDYVNARKIVNGLDQADRIAGYAEKIFNAINL